MVNCRRIVRSAMRASSAVASRPSSNTRRLSWRSSLLRTPFHHTSSARPYATSTTPRAATGLARPFVVGLTDVDPALDGAGEIFLPQVRLVTHAQALAEPQRRIGKQRESQQAHHHAFVGLGRMPGQGQAVIRVVVSI